VSGGCSEWRLEPATDARLRFTEKRAKQRRMLHIIALAMAAGYGVISLVGGLIGYFKAGSRASLIAGGLSGLLLLAGALLAINRPLLGLTLASLVSLALVARFAKSGGSQKRRSPLAPVMIGGGLAVVLASILALLS
jgi:uncharacterized membrane protein (UPF0136 family)